MTHSHDAFYDALATALYLTTEDLEANRNGQVSDDQKNRIHGQLRSASLGLGCMTLFSVLPAITLGLLVNSNLARAAILVGMVLWAWRYSGTLRNIKRQRQTIEADLDSGKVLAHYGPLTKRNEGKRAGSQLGIGEEFFLVPRAVFNAAPEGQEAVIYYLPDSKQFLSAELPGD